MKKIISVILSVIMLVACMTAAIPVSATESDTESAAVPIEATPLTGWTEGAWFWEYTTRTVTDISLGFTTAQGVKVTPKENNAGEYENIYETKSFASGTYYTQADSTYTRNPVSLNGVTHIIYYVKLEAANTVMPRIGLVNSSMPVHPDNDDWVGIDTDDEYQYAAIGDTSWSTGTAGASGNTSGHYGTMTFNNKFEGYIKIKVSDLCGNTRSDTVTDSDSITRWQLGIKGLGNDYGNVIAGPVFLVTSDSTSTKINVPDEYKPAPIEATPITGGERANYNSQYVSLSDVMPIGKLTTAKGIKLTPSNDALSYDEKDIYSSKANANYLFKEAPDAQTGTYYTLPDTFLTNGVFMLYVKTNTANAILPTVHFGKNSGKYNLTYSLKVGGTYSYAALDDDMWTEGTVKFTGLGVDSSRTDYGVIQLDSAFEGYIKIPISSFVAPEAGAINAIGRIEVKFAKVGGDDGDVIAGPFFYVTSDSTSTEINIPDEYKPAPLAVNSIEMGTVESRMTNFSVEENDSGYRLYIDPEVIGDSESAWVSGATKWSYVENKHTGSGLSANLLMKPAIPLAAKNVDGFLVYIKTEKANEFALTVEYEKGTHWNKSWNPSISLKPGETVQVLATGSDDWQEMSIVKGGIYGSDADATSVYGKVCFDKAFEGYIKIPFTSFGNDSNWAPYTTITNNALDRIVLFQAAFKGIGSTDYGEVVTDIVGFYTSDSPLTTFKVSAPIYDTGDVNNDCFVNGTDLKELRKHLLGIKAEVNTVYGNVNEDTDGNVDILDLIRLKKIIAGA